MHQDLINSGQTTEAKIAFIGSNAAQPLASLLALVAAGPLVDDDAVRQAGPGARARSGGRRPVGPGSRAHAKARSREVPMREGQFLSLLIFALTDDAWSGRPNAWPIISGTWDFGGDYREVLGAGRHRQPGGALFPGRGLAPWALSARPASACRRG